MLHSVQCFSAWRACFQGVYTSWISTAYPPSSQEYSMNLPTASCVPRGLRRGSALTSSKKKPTMLQPSILELHVGHQRRWSALPCFFLSDHFHLGCHSHLFQIRHITELETIQRWDNPLLFFRRFTADVLWASLQLERTCKHRHTFLTYPQGTYCVRCDYRPATIC